MTAQDWPPKILVCAGAVVLNKGKVLFIREAKGHHAGVWGIPWGVVEGQFEDGTIDSPEKTAVRETWEEAGIEVKVKGLIGFQNHASKSGEARIYFIFLAEHISGEPQPDGAETDRAEYLSLAEMQHWPEPIDEFVYWIVERVLEGEYTLTELVNETPYPPFMGFF